MEPRFRPAFAAASLVGSAVLVAFFVWHWFTIAPVWAVLAEGLVGVALAAAATGWAWTLARRAGRFGGNAGGLAFGALFAGGLVVGELLGLLLGPKPDPTSVRDVLAELPAALLPVVAVTLAGGWLARGWKGALAFGLASLVLLLYLGGSIVHRGGVGVGLALFLLLVPCYLLAGFAMGVLEPRLRRARIASVEAA